MSNNFENVLLFSTLTLLCWLERYDLRGKVFIILNQNV